MKSRMNGTNHLSETSTLVHTTYLHTFCCEYCCVYNGCSCSCVAMERDRVSVPIDLSKTNSRTIADTITGEHEHTICGYSLLKGIGDGEPVASERFFVGGHEWVLLFYPDGKKSSSSDHGNQMYRVRPNYELLGARDAAGNAPNAPAERDARGEARPDGVILAGVHVSEAQVTAAALAALSVVCFVHMWSNPSDHDIIPLIRDLLQYQYGCLLRLVACIRL